MDVVIIAKSVLLISAANGAPVVLAKLFGSRWDWPLDAGLFMPDGQPLFGRSKTLRGLLAAIVVASALAPLLGLPLYAGAGIGLLAMAGDLLSSFVKRRLRLPPSSRATGLDQVPESLLPGIGAMMLFGFGVGELVVIVALFSLGVVALSPLFFRLGIRKKPY